MCNHSSSGRARRASKCCSGSSRPRGGQQEAAAGGRSGLSCGSRQGGATSGGSNCTGPGSTSTSGGGSSSAPSSSRRAGRGRRCIRSECSVPVGASVPPAAGAVRRAVHTLPLLRTQVSNQAIMGVCVRWMSLAPAWLGSACLRLPEQLWPCAKRICVDSSALVPSPFPLLAGTTRSTCGPCGCTPAATAAWTTAGALQQSCPSGHTQTGCRRRLPSEGAVSEGMEKAHRAGSA